MIFKVSRTSGMKLIKPDLNYDKKGLSWSDRHTKETKLVDISTIAELMSIMAEYEQDRIVIEAPYEWDDDRNYKLELYDDWRE